MVELALSHQQLRRIFSQTKAARERYKLRIQWLLSGKRDCSTIKNTWTCIVFSVFAYIGISFQPCTCCKWLPWDYILNATTGSFRVVIVLQYSHFQLHCYHTRPCQQNFWNLQLPEQFLMHPFHVVPCECRQQESVWLCLWEKGMQTLFVQTFCHYIQTINGRCPIKLCVFRWMACTFHVYVCINVCVFR